MSQPGHENQIATAQKFVGQGRGGNQDSSARKSIGHDGGENQEASADRDKLFNGLRGLTSAREALVSFKTMATNRIKQAARNGGDNEYLDELILSQLDGIKDSKKKTITPIEKEITKLAKKIPECQTFNLVADIQDGYISAATIVSLLKDPRRFHCVHAMRKWCGYAPVNGKAAKHIRGQKSDWSPPAKNCLNKMAISIIKNRSNRWRPVYEKYLERELVRHDEICPKCETKQGHCGAMARRRVVQDILKEFWLVCNGQNRCENHQSTAVASRPNGQECNENQKVFANSKKRCGVTAKMTMKTIGSLLLHRNKIVIANRRKHAATRKNRKKKAV